MRRSDAHHTIDALWREEMPKIVGGLMRVVRDLDLAEELAQDALVAALETWPRTGVPDNPGAWLMTTARRRGIDRLRHSRMVDRHHGALAHAIEQAQHDADARAEAVRDDAIDDDVLRLVFVACHPVLPDAARVALTLRLIGGLTTDEIARAFLLPEATIAQRIVRAKRTLARSGAAFEVPVRDALPERLDAVLQVVYLVFNEGYAAAGGVLADLLPGEAEVHGLRALMQLQASRLAARTDAAGAPILLPDQDRRLWDRVLIDAGLASLARAAAVRGAASPAAYALQAEVAACHARAARAGDTDWPRIVLAYDRLLALDGSPVVALNRAVAVGMADGPAAALPLVDALQRVPALAAYHLLPGVRGDLLAKLARHAEAAQAFDAAAALARTPREQAWLAQRAADCRAAAVPG